MTLLDRMVGATPPAAELSETKTDAELIAEIAPAMLVKLRKDGSDRGAALGSTLFMCLGIWLLGDMAVQNLEPITMRPGPSLYFLYGLGIGAVLQIALPLFFKRRSVLNEVRYRRQHGKWRWER